MESQMAEVDGSFAADATGRQACCMRKPSTAGKFLSNLRWDVGYTMCAYETAFVA